ncbi:MAG: hypothetical protein NWE95_02240 [Candidatus Bathyarchaeota archaeon]|nr:hypothetical protein [Candidatus Bathyarchaeota archaeon]
MNTTVIAIVLAATVLSPTAFVIFESAQSQMVELNTQFNDVVNGTMSFFDDAWEVAKEFQNPDYDYNPSMLGNHTSIGNSPAS